MLRTEVDQQAGIVYKHMDLFSGNKITWAKLLHNQILASLLICYTQLLVILRERSPYKPFCHQEGGGVSSAIISLMENGNECH